MMKLKIFLCFIAVLFSVCWFFLDSKENNQVVVFSYFADMACENCNYLIIEKSEVDGEVQFMSV
jgi:hypothetical protein